MRKIISSERDLFSEDFDSSVSPIRNDPNNINRSKLTGWRAKNINGKVVHSTLPNRSMMGVMNEVNIK